MISIVIPTLDLRRANATSQSARKAAGIEAMEIIVRDFERDGFTRAINHGLCDSHAQGDFVLLNDDVTDFPLGWLEHLNAVLHNAPDIGLVGPAGDKSTEHTHDWAPERKGQQDVDHLSFWCVLIRREVIDDIGLLDERFIHYASDYDYCDRARAAGWRCVLDYDVVLTHLVAQSGTQVAWKGHDLSLYQYVRRKREGWKTAKSLRFS